MVETRERSFPSNSTNALLFRLVTHTFPVRLKTARYCGPSRGFGVGVMDGVYVIVGVLVGFGVEVEVGVAVVVGVKVGVFEAEGLGVGVSDGVGVMVGVIVSVAVGVSVTFGGLPLATKRKRHKQHKHNKTKTDTAAINVFRSGFFDKKALICSIVIRSPWNRSFYGAGVGGGLKRI
jgi:hypothetical protein